MMKSRLLPGLFLSWVWTEKSVCGNLLISLSNLLLVDSPCQQHVWDVTPKPYNCLKNWRVECLVSSSGRNLNVSIFQTYCIQNSGIGVPGTLDVLGMSLRLWINFNHFQTLVSSVQSPLLWAAVSCSLKRISKWGQMTASLQILMYSPTPKKLWAYNWQKAEAER